MWERELARAVERANEFDLVAEEAARLAEVVRWRRVSDHATFFSPVPLIARGIVREQGLWLPENTEAVDLPYLVGLDALGRPVISGRGSGGDWQGPDLLWSWTDELLEEASVRGGVRILARFPLDAGRLVGRVAASSDGEFEVDRWTFTEERLVRVDRASAREAGWASGYSWFGEHGADGDLQIIRVARTREDYREDNRLPAGEVLPALGAALERTASLEPGAVEWDARVDRLTEPLPGDPMSLVTPLARALDEAVSEAFSHVDVEEPFCLTLVSRESDLPPWLPPRVFVAGRIFRDRMRASSEIDGAAIHYAASAVDQGDVISVDLRERLDDDSLRACRALSTALQHGSWAQNRAAAAVAEAVADRLALTLNKRSWPGAAKPFLALVRMGDPYGDHAGEDQAVARARAAVGSDYVDQFLISVASTAPARRGRLAERAVVRAVSDRSALAQLIATGGLPEHAHRLAFEVAEVGCVIEPAKRANSRLGGPPLLSPGAEWPLTAGGQPLTFLAGIDFSELPAFEGRDRFPGSGWLLFFGDLNPDDAAWFEPCPNSAGELARVLWVPEELDPVGGQPPLASQETPVLAHRPVKFRPVLTLPNSYDTRGTLRLDAYESEIYESINDKLRVAALPRRGASEPWPPVHWLGGLATGAQGHEPEPDTVLLLHLSWDDELGLRFLDAGTLQFRIPSEALTGREFDRIWIEPDSA